MTMIGSEVLLGHHTMTAVASNMNMNEIVEIVASLPGV